MAVSGETITECSTENDCGPSRAIDLPGLSISDWKPAFDTFRNEFDKVYTEVAALVGHMGASVEQLVSGIEQFMNIHRPRLVEAVVSESRSMTTACHSQAGHLLTLMAKFAGQLDIMMRSAGQIGDALRKVGEVSSGLHLVGLNAFVATYNMGEDGVVTGVLAKALMDLAADDIKVVKRLGEAVGVLVRDSEDLLAGRDRLDDLLKQDFSSSDLPIGDLFSSLEGVVDDLVCLITAASCVRKSTGEVMLRLQRQDILRQGLDHVRLVLTTLDEERRKLPPGSDSEDESHRSKAVVFLVFQERAATLAAALLTDSASELRSLAEKTLGGIGEMKSAVQSLDSVREKIANAIRGKLQVPGAVFEAFAGRIHVQHAEVVRFRKVLESLSGVVGRLKSELSSLQQVRAQLGAIRVLMRTEAGRQDTWGATAAIIGDIHRGEQELQKFLDFNRQEAGTLVSALASVVETSNDLYQQRQYLSAMEDNLRRRPEELRRAGESFAGGFESVVRCTTGVRRTLESTAQDLSGFAARLDLLADMETKCLNLAATSKQIAQRLCKGSAVTTRIPPGKMAEVLDALTTFSHKSIGAEIAGLEVDVGDAGGTLTLF
jgi:ABC-type transporter Mla subunit MlaD